MLFAGIDIGSRSSKAVILSGKKVIASAISFETYMEASKRGLLVLNEALSKTSYKQKDFDAIVATGYGRISAPYADTTITEITCHAKGVHSLLPSVRTVIDIGGQDSKVIKLNDAGEIIDFTMNDRCAAGTGKFIEVTAKALNLELDEFSKLFFKSKKPCNISSMCTVFAESEVISLMASNVPRKDIVAGLIQAIASRIGNMAKRLGVQPDLAFTGGVAKNMGVRKKLEEITGHNFVDFGFDPQLVGAYGAAVLAKNQVKQKKTKLPNEKLATLKKLHNSLKARPGEITALRKKNKKVLGYFCSYVPEEIVDALGIVPVRLVRGGDVEAANIGNTYLTSNNCPYASSCVGLKAENRDFYFSNVDFIADAPSCYQMKRVLEIWEKYFDTKVIHIGFPRNFYQKTGVKFFTTCLNDFIHTLETETGKKLDPARLKDSVALYNKIRDNQQKLYRFLNSNKISWNDLIRFIQAGFVLDKKVYLGLLDELIKEIEKKKLQIKRSPIRILITGGMLAPGDDKLIKIFKDLDIDIAMDEFCSGSRNIYRNIGSSSIEDIASTYLTNVPCGALPYPDPVTDPRLKHMRKLIKDYKINGILYYTLRFCDAYSYKSKQTKKVCEKFNIPFLHLHSDYSSADIGQIKTRVEAFKESILGNRSN